MDKKEIYEILNKAYFSDEPDEKEILGNLPKVLHSVRTFVDIGASLGQYAFSANKCIQSGHIIAIEPDPIPFAELERNCSDWESLSSNKLEALHAAISDKDGKITFYTTNSNVSGGIFKHDITHLPEEYIQAVKWEEVSVDCFKVDTLFRDSSPDFIKIDVEGSELRVLRGSTAILKEGRAMFLVELHSWRDPKGQQRPMEVLGFMKSFGYDPLYFHGHTLFVKNPWSKVPRLWVKGKLGSVIRNLRSLLAGWRRRLCSVRTYV